jgi:hypothetical protein
MKYGEQLSTSMLICAYKARLVCRAGHRGVSAIVYLGARISRCLRYVALVEWAVSQLARELPPYRLSLGCAYNF